MSKNIKICLVFVLLIWFIGVSASIEYEKEIEAKQNEIEELKLEIKRLEKEIETISYEEILPNFVSFEVEEEEEVIEEVEIVEEVIDREWLALVSATFRLETGNGTSNMWVNHYNAGGIKCWNGNNDYCSYESEEEGLQALESLLESYVRDFGYDFKAIRNKYNPGDGQDYERFMVIYYEELNKLE